MPTYNAHPTPARFHSSDAFVRGLMGPVGSGKSVADCMEIIRRASEQEPGPDGIRRTRWAVIRNTYKELRSTTYNTWYQWANSLGTLNKADFVFYLKHDDIDAEIIFQALDRPEDVEKLLSLELTGAFVNEAREIPKAIIDMLQLRVGRYPSREANGVMPTWHGIIMDTNPPDSDHWWYATFEEKRPEGWELFKQPSGISEEAENVENLPKGYYTTMMSSQSDDWLRIYRDGEYGYVHEGKAVFPEYTDSVHCTKPLGPVPGVLYIGIDFGLTPACTMAQRDVLGRWAFIDELVTFDMGAVKFGELLSIRLNERYPYHEYVITGDPAGDQRSQVDERTAFQVLAAQGIKARPANTNDAVIRREALAAPMGRLIDGTPGFMVCPEKCPTLRKGLMGGYHYRRVQVSGDDRYHDKPDKNKFSHVCEAAEYLVVGAGEGHNIIRPKMGHAAPIQAVQSVNVFNTGRR